VLIVIFNHYEKPIFYQTQRERERGRECVSCLWLYAVFYTFVVIINLL